MPNLNRNLGQLLCTLGLVLPGTSLVYPRDNTSTKDGIFLQPAPISRPVFRYWLPDASVDADIVSGDIDAAAHVGAGGVEFLPFFEYGGQIGGMPAGANWSTYDFGTVPFRNLLSAALDAHEKNGLRMDVPLGPNQGQGVPAHPDDEGLQWDLVPFNATVPADGVYTDEIPGWGTGELVALVSALVLSNTTITQESESIAGLTNITYEELILSSGSLTEQTESVSTDGIANLTFPVASNGSHYRIFTFYQTLSHNKNLQFNSTVHNSIFDDGSYVVDHFSAAGAQTVANFWEEYILQDGVKEQLQRVGRYLWEDSLEILSNVSWSRSIPQKFQDLNGYSIKPVLPLLVFQENSVSSTNTDPGPFNCLLDTETKGIEHVNAFRKTLSESYKDYLAALKSWTNDLGLELSAQPAYGLPMDMQDSIPSLDAPECESLSFRDSIDGYRQFAGPAHLAGKNIISNELGAVAGAAYHYHMPELLFSANRGFASGVNRYVIHGQSYSGPYFSTWPGHTPFDYLFSEPWSYREPVWDHGMRETIDYISRVQYIQQSGTPKVDVAIYNKESATTMNRTMYQSMDLINAGWSYNYLNPENIASPEAIVQDGTLAPDGPAWKAFVVDSSSNVSLSAIVSIQKLADAGLPIVFVGGNPNLYPDGQEANYTLFQQELETLQSSANVYAAGEGELADKLTALGLSPRAQASTNGTWYTTVRNLNTSSYVFVYSDLVASQGSIIVADTRTPSFLDPWTGAQRPVLIYEQSNTTTTIPLTLAGNQTAIIQFSDTESVTEASNYHVVAAPDNVLSAESTETGQVSLHVAKSASDTEATMSDGSACALGGFSVPAAFGVQNWTLIAEHWEAPANLSETLPTSKRNTTHFLPKLLSWSEIPELVNASGLGYYSAEFQWPPADVTANGTAELGATISFGRLLHYARVSINGQQLPPLDPANAVTTITPYLSQGINKVDAVVPTTMWNYLRTILPDLRSAGQVPLLVTVGDLLGLSPSSFTDDNGLLGEVLVTPYVSVNC